MIKKISIFVIAAMLFLQTTIFSLESATIDVDVQQAGEMLSVSVFVPEEITDLPDRMTIQIFDSVGTLVYMRETKQKATTDGGTLYTFKQFSFKSGTPSGSYTLKVGGGSLPITTETVNYTSMTDLISALKAIDAVTFENASLLTTEMITNGNAAKAGLDVAVYGDLGDWQLKINEAIAKIDYGTNTLLDNDYEGFLDVRDKLAADFNEVVELALICGGGTEAQAIAAINDNKYSNIEHSEYFSKLTDLTFVAARMKEADYSQINFYDETKANVATIFDGAVVTAVLDQLDWETVQRAIDFYENKGLFTLNKTAFNQLSDKSEVYKQLKIAGITDYTKIPEKFAEIANTRYAIENPPSTGGGNFGGGGGFGGGITGSGSTGVIGGGSANKVEENINESTKPGTTVSFNDINNYSWAKTAIISLAELGIINGVGDNNFAPAANIKREEAAKMLAVAFELQGSVNVQFDDVAPNSWYYSYVSAMVDNGVINGISAQKFGAGMNITRQDMATMAYRAMCLKYNNTAKKTEDFADINDVSDYAKEAVSALKDMGVLNGYEDGTFAPTSYMSRAEFACMLFKILEIVR